MRRPSKPSAPPTKATGDAPKQASASAKKHIDSPASSASATASGLHKPVANRAPDSASSTASGLYKALVKDTASASASGLTVMVITQSGRKAKRMNIPRWLIFAAAFAWLSLMVAAFVWGFESAAPTHAPKGKSKVDQSSIDRTAMGPSPSSRQ